MGKKAAQRKARQQKRQQKLVRQQKRADLGLRAESLRKKREGRPSPEQPAGKYAALERVDSWSGIRNAIRHIAGERCEWAGIPMPIDGAQLIIEPTYPKANELMAMGAKKQDAEEEAFTKKAKVRNVFWSTRWRTYISMVEYDGKISMYPHHANHAGTELSTIFASVAWGLEQEKNALHTLGTMIRHHHFKSYVLTGAFLEKSKRSGLTYMFRRLRPTLVIDARNETDDTTPARILCALCLHPIGYYGGSWAGAMCPTDDVIAHLSMMRGDEPMLWRRANQIPPTSPGAGI